MSGWRAGPVALLGADGMLGRQWRRYLETKPGTRLDAIVYPMVDLERDESLLRAFEAAPRIVINCAAYTNVDQAESEPDKADRINATGVGRLAQLCRERGVTLVHYSTDYVFHGHATSPYAVDAPTDPINAYGRSKLLGEQLIRSGGCDFLLVRTSWLYAPWGKNFVRTIAAAARTKPELRVVNDQRGRPTSVASLVDVTARLLDGDLRGIFHATDAGECTWFELATAVASVAHPGCRVLPCSSDEYPRPARRPSYSVLDLDKTINAIGRLPHWRDALADVLPRLEP